MNHSLFTAFSGIMPKPLKLPLYSSSFMDDSPAKRLDSPAMQLDTILQQLDSRLHNADYFILNREYRIAAGLSPEVGAPGRVALLLENVAGTDELYKQDIKVQRLLYEAAGILRDIGR